MNVYMAFLHDTHTVTIYNKCAEEVLNYDQTEYTRTFTMLCECIVCKQPAIDVTVVTGWWCVRSGIDMSDGYMVTAQTWYNVWHLTCLNWCEHILNWKKTGISGQVTGAKFHFLQRILPLLRFRRFHITALNYLPMTQMGLIRVCVLNKWWV